MNTLLVESILSTNCFPHAAILRRKDASIKVRTSQWPLSVADTNRLSDLFLDASTTREQGFTLGGIPYKSIRVDDRSIYGKRDEEMLALIELKTSSSQNTHNLSTAMNQGGMMVSGGGSGVGHTTTTTVLPTLPSAPEKDKSVVEINRPISAITQSRSYNGIIICRTHLYFIVGIYDTHPGMAVEAMERLSDYFRSKKR